MKKIIMLVIVCFIVIPTIAQKQAWTFQQCLDTALQRNISVNQSRLSNEIDRINLQQSKANRLPSLNAGANGGVNYGKSLDPTTSGYVDEGLNTASFSVNSGMTLFGGLELQRTIEQYKMNLDAGKFDTEKIRNDVTLNITTAYLQLLFSYEILDAAKKQAESTSTQVDRTLKLVDAGKIPESNLYTIRSQMATDNLAIVNAEGQLEIARVTLMQLMEIPVLDSFDIEKPIVQEPAAMLLLTKTDIYNKALTTQPQISSAAIKTNSALLGIRITESARWPKLSLSGSINSNYANSSRSSSSRSLRDPFSTQLWNNLGEGIGMNLSIPIYSNRQIKSNIEKAKVNALSMQFNEQNTKNILRKAIEQSYTDLKTAGKKYQATKEQSLEAELAYLNMEKKYNVGMSTAIDYLIEKNIYFQAQSNLIQSKYDYLFKTKILDFYQGIPIVF